MCLHTFKVDAFRARKNERMSNSRSYEEYPKLALELRQSKAVNFISPSILCVSNIGGRLFRTEFNRPRKKYAQTKN